MIITDLLIQGAEKLEGVSTLPFLDAEVLMAFILDKNRAYVIAHSSDTVSIVQERQYNNLIGRRAGGEPIAYILEHKEFYGIDLYVDDRVLVPRPESEEIVDVVKEVIESRYGTVEHARVLDIGTGSGALAIAIARTLDERAHVIAVDASVDALNVAQINVEETKAKVQLMRSDVYSGLPEGIAPFDIIISNPPYLNAETTPVNTPDTVSLLHEPAMALYAEDDGFAVIESVLRGAAQQWLLPYGVMVLEIGSNHGDRLTALASEVLPTHTVELRSDFGGHTRIAILWPPKK